MRGIETPGRIVTNFCTGVGVHDVISSANFYDCRLWGLSVVEGVKFWVSPSTRVVALTTLALPCECVIWYLVLITYFAVNDAHLLMFSLKATGRPNL